MNIFFITSNQGKFDEAKEILPQLKQLKIDLPEIQTNDSHELIKEKLLTALKINKKRPLVVEDTSLHFDCLNGLPGPLIKWFMKSIGNEGLVKITEKLGNQKATAYTMIGYAESKNKMRFFEGEIEGKIVNSRGNQGFGWDSIFEIAELKKTFAQLSLEQKNQISMRRIAFEKLKKHVQK